MGLNFAADKPRMNAELRIMTQLFHEEIVALLFSLKHMACHALIDKISDQVNIFKQSFSSVSNEISPVLVTRAG